MDEGELRALEVCKWAQEIGIFDTYARSEEKKTSDIDVLVEFTEPSFDNFMDLAFFLEDLFGMEVVWTG